MKSLDFIRSGMAGATNTIRQPPRAMVLTDNGEVANEKVSRLWNERGKAQLPPPHSATNQKTREHNEMDTREKIYRATNVRMPSSEGFFALKTKEK